jgi:hypothetical protein
MKKYILAAALVLASASAMADRMVSGEGGGNPMGISKSSACQQAKSNASNRKRDDEEVVNYSRCDCSDKGIDSELPWSCTVDAHLAKKNE